VPGARQIPPLTLTPNSMKDSQGSQHPVAAMLWLNSSCVPQPHLSAQVEPWRLLTPPAVGPVPARRVSVRWAALLPKPALPLSLVLVKVIESTLNQNPKMVSRRLLPAETPGLLERSSLTASAGPGLAGSAQELTAVRPAAGQVVLAQPPQPGELVLTAEEALARLHPRNNLTMTQAHPPWTLLALVLPAVFQAAVPEALESQLLPGRCPKPPASWAPLLLHPLANWKVSATFSDLVQAAPRAV